MPIVSTGNSIANTAQVNPGVIENSDLANETIESGKIKNETILSEDIKDGEIKNSDISNSAAIDDSKLAEINDANKVDGSALKGLANIPPGAGVIPSANLPGGAVLTDIPEPVLPATGVTALTINNNVDANAGMFTLKNAITVNKLSFYCSAVSVAGTVLIGIFSEDGQTRHINITTASISAQGVITTSVPGVVLPAGKYYVVIVRGVNTNITVSAWTDMTTALNLANVSSEPLLRGLLTVTANTMPSTFTVTANANFQDIANKGLIIRLDN